MYLLVRHPAAPCPQPLPFLASHLGPVVWRWALLRSLKGSSARKHPPSGSQGVFVKPLQKVVWVLFSQKSFLSQNIEQVRDGL